MLSFRGEGSGPGKFIFFSPPTWLSKYLIFVNNPYSKLSEYEDVSIINIIQVKFSCFLCRIDSNDKLRGGGKLSRVDDLAPTHLGIKVKLFC